MNLLIVDDHPLVCSGIRNILISEKDIDNVLQANDVKIALKLISENNIDLSLVDMRLRNESGIDFVVAAKKCRPDCKFVILSSSSTSGDFNKALQAGVDGYILKDAFPDDIIYAVKTVLRGRKYFDPVFVENKSPGPQSHKQEYADDALSPREAEILDYLGKGLSNKSIADRLYISENTVKKHVSNILAKLKFDDRTQAALYISKTLLYRQDPE